MIAAVAMHLALQSAESSTPPAGAAAAVPAPAPSAVTWSDGQLHLGPATLTPVAYVEAEYSYNFNRPSNSITSYRAFDNRHGTFNLSNAVLGTAWQAGEVSGKIVFQVGNTPSTYYASEPTRPGGVGAGPSDASTWRFLQEANLGWRAPVGTGLLLEAGLFLSPMGPEAMAIKDDWYWSRSNLFFGFPFYHAGARASYDLAPHLTATLAAYNGWSNVVDNNQDKSVSASLAYVLPERLRAQLLYFGGIERPSGAPEGPYVRHDIDAYAEVFATPRLAFRVASNGGWEPNRFGTSRWFAGALSGRVKAMPWLYVALRGDRFWEHVASNERGTASAIFWPSKWVSSGTATLDFRPVDHLSVRLEYRHDRADSDIYYRGTVVGAGTDASPFVPNAHTQDTLTLGATAWL